MKTLVLFMVFTITVFAGNLEIQGGHVKAHASMSMDDDINIYHRDIQADVSMKQNDPLTLKGRFSTKMNLFASSNKSRDENMKEVIEPGKFPWAAYDIECVEKVDENGNYLLHGKLSFHGVKRDFTMMAQIQNDTDSLSIKAHSDFLMSDFEVEAPCLLFLCVEDKLEISTEVTLQK